MKPIALFLVVFAAVTAFFWWGRGPQIRYRVTATVESGGKLYVGTGVIQISVRLNQIWTPQTSAFAKGDAVVVDVPGHLPVFVLLSGARDADWAASIPFELFQAQLGPASLADRSKALATKPFKAELPVAQYPMLVAFRDLNDPASVYEVRPNDLSPPLDPGAHVVGMTIEMTRDRVTYQVDKLLPWVAHTGGNLKGEKYKSGTELAGKLGAPDFRKRGG